MTQFANYYVVSRTVIHEARRAADNKIHTRCGQACFQRSPGVHMPKEFRKLRNAYSRHTYCSKCRAAKQWPEAVRKKGE